MDALFDAIDLVILPVSSLDAAAERFARLGLRAAPGSRHAGLGTENRMLAVGGPDTLFWIELLAVADPAEHAVSALGRATMQGVDQGLSMVVLRTSDLAAALAELARRGVAAEAQTVRNPDGETLCDFALLPDHPDAATRLGMIQYPRSPAERHARFGEVGALAHDLPLKRLDHLAAVAPDLDRSSRYWTDVLGVPVWGEVRTPTTVIRQHRVGDAVFELLGPAGPDSPIHQRPPGLASMCSFEVDDLPAVVSQLRAAGVILPDAAPGSLPGTHTSTVPREQTGGLNLQLLQYV